VPMERQSRRESRRGASTDWGFCQMSRIAEIGWNIIAARKYDVYGMVRSGQLGSSSQKYVGGLGHESEGNTGLIYMRARYMDPVVGRFISEDIRHQGSDWFIYSQDNPVNQFDIDGMTAVDDFLEYIREWCCSWSQRTIDLYINALLALGLGLITTGLSAAIAGYGLVRAAEVWSEVSKTGVSLAVNGGILMRSGVYMCIAGAILTIAAFYLNGITDPSSEGADIGAAFIETAQMLLDAT